MLATLPAIFSTRGQGSWVLFAVAFDLRALQTEGSPIPLLQDVYNFYSNGNAYYAVAPDGSIIYLPEVPGTNDFELVWVDRDGSTEPLSTRLRPYADPRISPDGKRLALTISEPKGDIWIYDIAQDAWQRLTSGSPDAESEYPLWSPDGELLLFSSNRNGPYDLFVIPADGSGPARQLTQRKSWPFPLSWSRSGLVAVQEQPPGSRHDILVARFEQLEDPDPLWSRDGQEIFFRNGDRMMTVSVDTRQDFTAGPPRALFELETVGRALYLREYDAFLDGQRFVMVRRTSPEPAYKQFNIVLNWFEELKQLAPTDQ